MLVRRARRRKTANPKSSPMKASRTKESADHKQRDSPPLARSKNPPARGGPPKDICHALHHMSRSLSSPVLRKQSRVRDISQSQKLVNGREEHSTHVFVHGGLQVKPNTSMQRQRQLGGTVQGRVAQDGLSCSSFDCESPTTSTPHKRPGVYLMSMA